MSTSAESCALGHKVSAGPARGAGRGLLRAYLPRAATKNTPSSEERALLQQLKEVTDRQRDELRAHNRDLLQRSQETEAVREGPGDGAGRGSLGPSALRPPAPPFAPPPVAGAAAAPPTGECRAAAEVGRGANTAARRAGPRE